MGKNAKPNVAIEAKNHIENQTFLSASTLLYIEFSILRVKLFIVLLTKLG
jgi:hypothetical protein